MKYSFFFSLYIQLTRIYDAFLKLWPGQNAYLLFLVNLVNFPLHSITSLHHQPHETINYLQKVVVILSHFSSRKAHKSSIFWLFLLWAFSPMTFPIFSWGFISGFCGGYFMTAIPSFSRKLNTVLALWQITLSCKNIWVSTVPLRKGWRACWQRSSL